MIGKHFFYFANEENQSGGILKKNKDVEKDKDVGLQQEMIIQNQGRRNR